MTRPEMIQRLVAVQNAPGNGVYVDILTITGFMTDEQVAAHLRATKPRNWNASHALKPRRRAS